MEVYVYEYEEWVQGDCTHTVEVYASLDDAMEQLVKDKDRAIGLFKNFYSSEDKYEMDEYLDGDMSWSIWESCAAMEYSINIQVYQTVIK